MCAGVVLLDLEAADLPEIAEYVVSALVNEGQLAEEKRGHVTDILLLKHRYACDWPTEWATFAD